MNEKIWLSPPHLKGDEMEFIQDAFHKNWVTTIGENIDAFEDSIDTYLSSNIHSVALNSCTSAIHLALDLLHVKSGDEVISQSFTFAGSVFPIKYTGATPIFIDSEKETWNMDPEALEIAVKDRIKKGKRPKAIIPVHLYGMPYKVDEINAIARHYEIPVIEDAAEALGSVYKGSKCGTLGDFGTISFNGNKIITTSGGGVLICSTKEIKEKAIFLASHARDKAKHYQHSEVGFNYRLSNILAGLGRSQMRVLESRIESRRKNHLFYADLFREIQGVKVLTEPTSDFYSNHWLSAITIDTDKKNEVLHHAFKEQNIESRFLWKPMHLQPVFKQSPYYGGSIAEDIFTKGLCLPSGSNLSDDQKSRIAQVVFDVFK